MSLETLNMLSSYSDNKLAKTIVKFIDIVLNLYSPVPFEIRNQMRILQNTLLYSKEKNLDDYIDQLEDKLNIKDKYKLAQQTFTQSNLQTVAQVSAIKTYRNVLNESDKENMINISNIKLRNEENIKKYENSLTPPYLLGQSNNRSRKISSIQSCDKSFDCDQMHSKNTQTKQIGKNSSRTLLKIIKRNKSSKQKLSVTQRSSIQQKIADTLKTNISQILQIMDSTQQLIVF